MLGSQDLQQQQALGLKPPGKTNNYLTKPRIKPSSSKTQTKPRFITIMILQRDATFSKYGSWKDDYDCGRYLCHPFLPQKKISNQFILAQDILQTSGASFSRNLNHASIPPAGLAQRNLPYQLDGLSKYQNDMLDNQQSIMLPKFSFVKSLQSSSSKTQKSGLKLLTFCTTNRATEFFIFFGHWDALNTCCIDSIKPSTDWQLISNYLPLSAITISS